MQHSQHLRARDEALEHLLRHYATNSVFNSRATLQGGGALHFMYGSPRYSTDLDFVDETLNSSSPLLDVLAQPIPYKAGFITPVVKSDFRGIGHARAKCTFPSGIVAKVELVCVPTETGTVTPGKYTPLKVEAPSELYADKLTANLIRMKERASFKPTDLFDLNWLRSNFPLPCTERVKEMVHEKIEHYQATHVTPRDSAHAIIATIRRPDFQILSRRELQKTLLPDVFTQGKFNASYFNSAAEHFEIFL